MIPALAVAVFMLFGCVEFCSAETAREGSVSPVYSAEKKMVQTFSVSAEDLYFQETGEGEVVEYEGRDAVLLNTGEVLCFDIALPESGEYYMSLEYYQPDDAMMTARMSVSVNDREDYSGMKLPVWWKNNTEYGTDEYGNELLQMPDRIYEWTKYTLNSNIYQYENGIPFAFEKGDNHVELVLSETPIYVAEITLIEAVSESSAPDYTLETVTPEGEPWLRVIEGEGYTEQNNAQIRSAKSKDANLVPFSPSVNKINALAGESWSEVGDSVTWEFSVPEDGYYSIVVKYRQDQKKDLSSYRHIYIDGMIPVQEFANYGFSYTGTKNRNEILSIDGETVSFYLTAGVHEITMETTAAPFERANDLVLQLVADMNSVVMSIREVTGGKTDKDRDWNIEKYVPTLRDDLNGLLSKMEELEAVLVELNGGNYVLSTIRVAHKEVEKYLEEKDGLEILVNNLDDFAQASGSVSEQIAQMSGNLVSQPLTIDRIYITNSVDNVPKENIGFFESAWCEIRKLVMSFFVESDRSQALDEDCVNVWMLGSTPQVEVLKQLVAQEYGDQKVKVSLILNEQKLLMAIASGETPDVILGGGRITPYDLGIRGAVYDLTQFEDFKEYASSFNSEFFVPFIDGDAVYAFPQNLTFFVTFYREDILDSLDISVPKSWDELITILPKLYRHGMGVNTMLAIPNSYKPLVFSYPYLSQSDASIYSEDGLTMALGETATMNGFRLMTELHTKYSVDTTISNFYMSFRNGTVPIGISDIVTYVLLKNSSEEISGLWSLAPGLGVLQEDGTVNNGYPAVNTPCYILGDTDRPQESWEFLKWWMSTDTQLAYSEMLCATYGDEYFWTSANLEVLEKVSILSEKDKAVILEQVKSVKELPSHPAYVLIERELSNAWSEVVVSGEDIRSAADSAVIKANRDIRRKLQELGYLDEYGNVIRPLEISDSEKAKELTGGK